MQGLFNPLKGKHRSVGGVSEKETVTFWLEPVRAIRYLSCVPIKSGIPARAGAKCFSAPFPYSDYSPSCCAGIPIKLNIDRR